MTPTAESGRPGAGPALSWAVFDIDGVVADVRHRLHHIEGPRPSWSAFFRAARHDPPLAQGLALVRELAAENAVAYVTGRPAWLHDVTEQWIQDHGLPTGPLRMRRNGDHRPARIVKLELLVALARSAPIALVVDDDPDVVAALRGAHIPVRHATWAGRSRMLRRAQEDQGRT